MTVLKGFLIIVLSCVGFALGGALIGYTLGVARPGYYRAVFSSGREPWFDPVAVGLGLGLTQGLIGGLVVGAVVVLAVAWHSSRHRTLDIESRSPRAGAMGRSVGAQGITTLPE